MTPSLTRDRQAVKRMTYVSPQEAPNGHQLQAPDTFILIVEKQHAIVHWPQASFITVTRLRLVERLHHGETDGATAGETELVTMHNVSTFK